MQLPSIAQALLNTPTPYPTNYPVDRQTAEIGYELTLEAITVTPIFVLPPPIEAPISYIPIGIPAGAGIITHDFMSPIRGIINGWYKQTPNGGLLVYAGGSSTIAPTDMHGIIGVVHLYPGNDFSDLTWFLAPEGVGALTIVGAEGERLILNDSQNQTYYFDVPGRAFVLSLTEVVPTVTTIPTFTSAPKTPLYNDDVPDDPWLIDFTSPSNINLDYTISYNDDIDWFRFHNDFHGTIQVDLTNLSVNYDLFVYSASDSQLRGSSTNSGQVPEQVIISNAPADDYYIQIVGADVSDFSSAPYTLRFNAPQAPTATPLATDTLEPTATETIVATESPTFAPTDTPSPVPSDTPTPAPTNTATSTFTPSPTATFTATATTQPLTATFYLHGTGANANPATLFLDSTAPTGSTAKYKDSTSINFNNGNLWKEVGTWTAGSALTNGQLATLSDLHVWLGLKNSDDQGTRFDLRAEVYKNGVLITAGESNCIADVTRNANQAKEAVVPFGAFDSINFDGSTDTLTLKLLTRIGTDSTGAFCGGHSNAVGLRLYFDATTRAATFGAP
jgi:hypothetical protein